MDDTDKLVAAMFASMMTSKQTSPTLAEFWGHYDICLKEARERAQAAKVAEDQRVARLMAAVPRGA